MSDWRGWSHRSCDTQSGTITGIEKKIRNKNYYKTQCSLALTRIPLAVSVEEHSV